MQISSQSLPPTIPIYSHSPPDYGALIERDRVHSSVYTSAQVFDEEMKKLFYGGWVFVGHESEIPNPNDYLTRMLGREPVIMVRARDGAINVLANRCTHRGNLLCPREKGTARAFTCDYHGWTFNHAGELAGVPYRGGEAKDRACLSLQKPALVDQCGGFVFASFNPDAGPLSEHLGNAQHLIERSVSLSPTGRILLNAGWVKQHFQANWKMLPENSTDGYHAPFTHASFLRTFAPNSQYEMLAQGEDQRRSKAVDWGRGHVALEHAPSYDRPLQWLGTTEEKVPDYVADMKAAYGEEAAIKKLMEGPVHASIFPNLFLGEMNVAIFQPISVNECVLWHTPLLLDGVAQQINTRIIRQSQAAMGPSSFLLADDSIISERQQTALDGRGGWLDLSRGLGREETHDDGAIWGHISDETTNRGFWSRYLEAMQS
ncbi:MULTISPECIES: aromatic ring-hydroxylating dioxygenase subunit alpha [unclassified Variovorax]|uniref:aromatic ring-hydroxylating oxygenase subunit alpha n=1 Tax=unclassified Variovorax TaxID=663243 RepID=UPI00083884EC|nr:MULTISPECIES: aromatic ring-hydroxylating dioxygenase subunit alpha [unclassified Variovorax]PNG46098.1 2-halobenzoate 1,2-dioxygenase large subunit [Variovorax sp. B2]PNG46243.1 2-halobenzoate 1,2-dioxygenase large subunit [Variovorax sp. B4]VTV19218.1 2-halobenzoate 1,2-dioxygenase large subunit [Variovorax sp. WDL1]